MGKRSPEKAQTERKKKADGVGRRFTGDEKVRNRNDFIRAYAEGKRRGCSEFAGFYLKTEHGPTRLGLSVGKKVGGAVVRNRVKRCIREIFRLHKHLLKPGYDIVLNVRKGCETRKYSELENSILRFFSATGLLDRPPDQTPSETSSK